MARPTIGIIGNHHLIDESYPVHAGGTMNSDAVAQVAGGLPLIVPTDPRFAPVEELLETCDGFLLTGGRPNVHPEEYGHTPTEAHGAFDRARDAVSPCRWCAACVARGQPVFGVCRGFQEVNVAMGGTLHPEIRESARGATTTHAARRHAGGEVRPASLRRFTQGGVSPPADRRRGRS